MSSGLESLIIDVLVGAWLLVQPEPLGQVLPRGA